MENCHYHYFITTNWYKLSRCCLMHCCFSANDCTPHLSKVVGSKQNTKTITNINLICHPYRRNGTQPLLCTSVDLQTFGYFRLATEKNSNYRYQFTSLAKQAMLMNTGTLKYLSNNILRDHPKNPSVNLESAT